MSASGFLMLLKHAANARLLLGSSELLAEQHSVRKLQVCSVHGISTCLVLQSEFRALVTHA